MKIREMSFSDIWEGGIDFMRKKNRLIICIFAVNLLICACGVTVRFSGSKTGDADHFDMDFEMLNETYSHELDMKEGESLDVSVERISGEISIIIQKENEKPVYRGTDMDTCNFQVQVEKVGTYTLSVTGKEAQGHVVFTRQ